METVFAELSEIGTTLTVEPYQKIKRNAFVFITAEPDSCHVALEDLRKIEDVTEVYLARGAYDLVAKISGDSLDHLRENVLKRIKNLSSVKSTLTLTII
ncbi:MAG: Lrp/AsnC ligand binding domain-containing protein [Candidatus Bathyarchaeota archaeon]|nr:Lrp/AsnC ligand binding domain-containing protein [Candidatus Bathyarchaeota archaeon]